MKEILCTLGPSTLNPHMIKRMTTDGVNLFRLNLSHMSYNDLLPAVELIRKHSAVPICFDSEGAQIRTGKFAEGKVFLNQYSLVEISEKFVSGSATSFTLYPPGITKHFQEGDIFSLDFNSSVLQVSQVRDESITARVINPGWVGSNKAVSINRKIDMDPFTEKDLKAFELANQLDIKFVALSFANRASDVQSLRKIVNKGVKIISKIECQNGLLNLDEITNASDAILIDRGDLSREVGIELIPLWQKRIISQVKKLNKKIYVATNLLETMIHHSVPTRAEVNDIYNTLLDGADGLVLAAETAIGAYPIQCIGVINKVQKLMDKFYEKNIPVDLTSEDGSLSLTSPHGGVLKISIENGVDTSKLDHTLSVSEEAILDCYQMANGGYSPVDSFLSKEELTSVLDNYKLLDGNVWTMPILLQVSEAESQKIKKGDRVGLYLKDDKNKTVNYFVKVESLYIVDLNEVCKKWFATDSEEHPGVQKIKSKGKFLVSGKVTQISKPTLELTSFSYTPTEVRYIFEKKGWAKIVGFHSRNVPHGAHVFIQKEALNSLGADGLLVSPVFGPKKKGDFLSDVIVDSYVKLYKLDRYPQNKFFLNGFYSYSRFCGPREALFTAICRQNMGCSHFIIGRDHAGVGEFYSKYASQELFDKLGDGVRIVPVFFSECNYNEETGSYVQSTEEVSSDKKISGSEARKSILNKSWLPNWYIDTEVQRGLFDRVSSSGKIFEE